MLTAPQQMRVFLRTNRPALKQESTVNVNAFATCETKRPAGVTERNGGLTGPGLAYRYRDCFTRSCCTQNPLYLLVHWSLLGVSNRSYTTQPTCDPIRHMSMRVVVIANERRYSISNDLSCLWYYTDQRAVSSLSVCTLVARYVAVVRSSFHIVSKGNIIFFRSTIIREFFCVEIRWEKTLCLWKWD